MPVVVTRPNVALQDCSPIQGLLSSILHSPIGYFPEGVPLAYLIATVVTGLGLLIGAVIQVAGPEEVARQSASPPSPPLPSPLSGRPNYRLGRLQVGEKGIRD